MEVPAYCADPTLFVLKGGKVLAIVAWSPPAHGLSQEPANPYSPSLLPQRR
jgi:hypothetical protein